MRNQWRIEVKSDDGAEIRYEEPFEGTEVEGKRRARLMWARTSYVVNAKRHRDVYVLLELCDMSTGELRYHKVWEHRGRLPDGARAPSGS